MIDVTQYIPEHGNRQWIEDYYNKMGEKLTDYYNKVFLSLYEMKPGAVIDIEKSVAPHNYDLFIKCFWLAYQHLYRSCVGSYYLEGSLILRR